MIQYWKDNLVPGCACHFCRGNWTVKDGYAYGAGNYMTKCQNKKQSHGLQIDGITGQPGFSAKEVEVYGSKPRRPTFVMARLAPRDGVNCGRCGMHNPHAGPNKEDGTYVCYNCR